MSAGVGGEAEEDEEHRGEQVAQRRQHLGGVVRHRAGERDADQERADRRGDLELGGHPGHEQGQARAR